MRIKFLFSVLMISLIAYSCGESNKTSHGDFVIDHPEILSSKEKNNLNDEIQELEKSVGSQLRILILDSLNGEDINDYATKYFNDKGIGRKGVDDGILILVAFKEKKIRIEVGYGLEKIVSDEKASEIIQNEMIPNFKTKKYYDGIMAAVLQMKGMIKENINLVGKRDSVSQ